MLLPVRLLIASAIVLTGCTTAKKVAVSSFRVIDTPAQYVRKKIDASEETTTTATTTAGASDVVTNPGAPVVAPPPTVTTQRRTTASTHESTASTGPDATSVERKSAPSASTRPAGSQSPQFPTARAVPGKPGFVYSVDPKGGIVDVTGYKSGDKAKDPYTQQIFIVP